MIITGYDRHVDRHILTNKRNALLGLLLVHIAIGVFGERDLFGNTETDVERYVSQMLQIVVLDSIFLNDNFIASGGVNGNAYAIAAAVKYFLFGCDNTIPTQVLRKASHDVIVGRFANVRVKHGTIELSETKL